MIKNIIFDCSDTLLRFHAKEDLVALLQSPERAERIYNAFMKSDIWKQYDNGLVSDQEMKSAVLPTLFEEDREAGEAYFDGFIDHYSPIDGIEALLEELKERGYSLYVLSDFPHKFLQLWNRFDLFRLFDGHAVSFEAKGSKKDLRLFDYFLKTYGLNASECLFVDDLEYLVANAATCGIRGHVFRGVEELRAFLKQAAVL